MRKTLKKNWRCYNLKIYYTPDARDKLKQLKVKMGVKTANRIITAINTLSSNPYQCPSIKNMLGIPSPYHFLHAEHHYIFYRISQNRLLISDIYNERENFMQKLFGISLRTQKSIDYWGE